VTVQHVQARPGAYADSVTLMQVSATAQAVDGVRSALVAMATDLNLALLAGLGLAAPSGISQHDLLIAIQADDDGALTTALAAVDAALSSGPPMPGKQAAADWRPVTTGTAVSQTGPGIALVSVPGQYALAEAIDALNSGCDVMIFSDNVPVEHEVVIKDLAAERGLLVMGPDCGTAIVGGIGLGFANAIRSGPIGLVAASGTGAQQLSCLIDQAGSGCSAVLGVGGRDLSEQVGGRSARAALAALDQDPATELIVLLSKPPAARVAADLRDYARTLSTPVQFALIGPGQPDLTEAAQAALGAIGHAVPDWQYWPPGAGGTLAGRPGALRGLFTGGTLCDEAMVIAAARLGEIYSNVPLAPELLVDALGPQRPADQRFPAARHIMIDFGADELTAGRPHPMIDQRLRLERLAAEAADPSTAVIMLDVVLGYGAHADPASELAPVISAATADRPGLAVVVSVIGTERDPQGQAGQVSCLAQAGAHVFSSNGRAARFACDLIPSA
jgi:FdrA protein